MQCRFECYLDIRVLAEINQLAKEINEIEASSCVNINLLIEVNQMLLDGDKQNVVAVATNRVSVP